MERAGGLHNEKKKTEQAFYRLEMNINNTKWKLNNILFADDTVVLQKLVHEFNTQARELNLMRVN